MLAFHFIIIVAHKQKRRVVLVMGYRIERWIRVPGYKQVVLSDVCLLPRLWLLLRAVISWSLCARQSRDGVGCCHWSWTPPWRVVIRLKVRRNCCHSWDTELGLF